MNTKNNSTNIALLVEDYKMDAGMTLPLLLDAGYKESNIHVSETREDVEQFLKKNQPELVILDLEIPKTKGESRSLKNGLSLLRYLVRKYGDKVKIITFSRYPQLSVVYQVVSFGVSFITKEDYNKEFFLTALAQVRNGHMVVSAGVLPVLKQVFISALRVGLDEEDKKILQLILIGRTDREIAEEMKYGDEWVASRLRRMFKAFGFRSREDLAAWFSDYVAPLHGIELEEK